jgi:hypothetical protein
MLTMGSFGFATVQLAMSLLVLDITDQRCMGSPLNQLAPRRANALRMTPQITRQSARLDSATDHVTALISMMS